MNKDLMFSSQSGEWEIPWDLFDEWNARFRFKLDVCATADNTKCDRYYAKEENGLTSPWNDVWWCNPPYGRDVNEWVKKAYYSDAAGAMLLPARTDTAWFHEYIYNKNLVTPYFLKGRIKFVAAKASAHFPV